MPSEQDYPSQEAMQAAVDIELMVSIGGYATVAYGRAIQKAIDKAVANVLPDCQYL
jgi:ribosomal protein S9